MNKKAYLIAACGLLATVLACSDKSSSPAAPTPVTNGTGSNAPATADGIDPESAPAHAGRRRPTAPRSRTSTSSSR